MYYDIITNLELNNIIYEKDLYNFNLIDKNIIYTISLIVVFSYFIL